MVIFLERTQHQVNFRDRSSSESLFGLALNFSSSYVSTKEKSNMQNYGHLTDIPKYFGKIHQKINENKY